MARNVKTAVSRVLNTNSFKETVERMTREEIEKQMDNLARKYVETHDPELIEALYQLARLARELEKMEKESGS
jgi:hypothetical protein